MLNAKYDWEYFRYTSWSISKLRSERCARALNDLAQVTDSSDRLHIRLIILILNGPQTSDSDHKLFQHKALPLILNVSLSKQEKSFVNFNNNYYSLTGCEGRTVKSKVLKYGPTLRELSISRYPTSNPVNK